METLKKELFYYAVSLILGIIDVLAIKYTLGDINLYLFTFLMCTAIYIQMHIVHMIVNYINDLTLIRVMAEEHIEELSKRGCINDRSK